MHSENYLWKEKKILRINRKHVIQSSDSDDTLALNTTVFHNLNGQNLVAQFIVMDKKDLPPVQDFIHKAQKIL